MSVASWCCKCFCVVLCVSFCTCHFVMVPLNMTYLHCLQHSLFEHLFNLYYTLIRLHLGGQSNKHCFWVDRTSPYTSQATDGFLEAVRGNCTGFCVFSSINYHREHLLPMSCLAKLRNINVVCKHILLLQA